MRTLPKLKADTTTLFNLYANYGAVQTKDIVNLFGVKGTTAREIMNQLYSYCKANNIPLYCTERHKVIPVSALFTVYGWNREEVVKKYRLLK